MSSYEIFETPILAPMHNNLLLWLSNITNHDSINNEDYYNNNGNNDNFGCWVTLSGELRYCLQWWDSLFW